MPPVTAICLTILAVLTMAGGALLTLAGAIGVAVGRDLGEEGMRLAFAIFGTVGLILFLIGATCTARLLV